MKGSYDPIHLVGFSVVAASGLTEGCELLREVVALLRRCKQ
jgi:hypothetical protein